MSFIDWTILIVCLAGIIIYGVYKSHTTKNIDGYFLSNRNMPWYLLLLGIMGTQASAITFLTGGGRLIQTECVLCNIILACLWPCL